jgi:peptide/nickel transport system ATP-binding protein
MSATVLTIENLSVALPSWADRPFAVDGVSLQVLRREILCVVGESGSGKSVMAKSVLQLLPEPHVRVASGRIVYEGTDLLTLPPDGIRAIRGGRIAMIFQEPMVALNPLMTVGRQTDEIIEVHTRMRSAERRKRIIELFRDVRLPEPELILASYPHELSGGQRQRVMIAMALALEPALIIADEPTTALDVTTQAQILRLLKELQARHGTAILFITHDFGVVAEIAERVVVMRQGKLVEHGLASDVLLRPQHEYTRALVAAVPSLTPRRMAPNGLANCAEQALLSLAGVEKTYSRRGGPFALGRRPVPAVAGVSLNIAKGRSLALVGESGSGKSTLARCIVGLERTGSRCGRAGGCRSCPLVAGQDASIPQGVADDFPGPVRLT